MYILYLYVQTVTRQCFCFPNSQWGVTAHDILVTFSNFSQTKEENRIPKLKPKPRMNFSTQAKQIVSQKQ